MQSNSIHCFICNKNLKLNQIWPSIRTQCAAYTATPIQVYLEQLSCKTPLCETDSELDAIVICNECQGKINDYDLACSQARTIENDLRTLLNKSRELNIKPEPAIKEEDVELGKTEANSCDDNIDMQIDSE